MEVLFWTGMYVLVAVLFYLSTLWVEDLDPGYYNFENTIPVALISILWPLGMIVLIVCFPFYGVFKLYVYYKTRKTIE